MHDIHLFCAWREEFEREPWLLCRVLVDLVDEFHDEGNSTDPMEVDGQYF